MRYPYFFLFLCCVPFLLQAQSSGWGNYTFANTILTAAETTDDVWLGVQGGIIQVDAQTEEMTFHDNASAGFGADQIMDLWADADDRLYYLTYPNKMGYWDGEAWRLLTHFNPNGGSIFYQIAGKNESGDFYLLGYDGFLHRVSPDGQIALVGTIPYNDLGESLNGTFDHHNGQTVIWGHRQIGVWKDDEYTALLTTPHDYLQNAYPGEGEEIWIQASFHLYHYDGSEWQSIAYDQIGDGNFNVYGFSPISADKGFLVVGAVPYEITVEEGALEWREADYDFEENALPLHRVYVDQQERFWYFGSYQAQLWVWQEGRGAQIVEKQSWLPFADAQTIGIDPEGRVWIGGWSGLAYLHGGGWHVLDQSTAFNPAGINELLFTKDGRPIAATGSLLVFGPPTGEVIQWNPATTSWDTLDRTGSPLQGLLVSHLLRDRNENIWITGGAQNIFSIYSREKWFNFRISDVPLVADFFSAFAEDPQGVVWIGTNKGLITYDGFSFSVAADSATLDLVNNNIVDLEFDHNGELWVAAGADGIRRWNGQEWKAYRAGEDLPEESYCTKLSTDLQGQMWVSLGWQGVARFDGTEWTPFTVENSGLHSNYINDLACDHQGRMWFGGATGLSYYWSGHAIIEPFRLQTEQELAVYPNPGCCYFQASWRNEEATNAGLVIYDVMGREIRRIPTGDRPAGEHFIQFERGNLLPGLYYLSLVGDRKGKAAPFVVR